MGFEVILSGIVTALIAVIAAFSRGKSTGRKEAQNDAIKDTSQSLENGRNAVRAGRDKSPEQRMRDNDGKW